MFWEVDGKQDSLRLEFQMNKAKISPSDKMGAVYSEAYFNHNSQDNVGKTCFDIWVQFPIEPPKKEDPPKEEEKEKEAEKVEEEEKVVEKASTQKTEDCILTKKK